MLTVELFAYTGETLDLRETVTRLIKETEKNENDKIILDFENITFISRAAADQLLKEKEKLSKKNIEVSFLNLNNNTSEMLAMVSQRAKSKPNLSDLRIIEIDQPHRVISLLSKLFHKTA